MKAKVLASIMNQLRLYRNTVVPNSVVKSNGKEKIIEELKKHGFVCEMSECEHLIPDAKKNQTDTDYILEVVC
ncbi:hypothetical protein ACWG0P_07270 [Amedibacillus sp. YH-ame6]